MKVAALTISLLAFVSGRAAAGTVSMVCENPRQEYTVSFDEASETFMADQTLYSVLAVEQTVERYVVAGLTVENGPTFRAHFRPYRKMEFFQDNQLAQTDGCR